LCSIKRDGSTLLQNGRQFERFTSCQRINALTTRLALPSGHRRTPRPHRKIIRLTLPLRIARILPGAFCWRCAAQRVHVRAERTGAAGGIADLTLICCVDGAASDTSVADHAALAAALICRFVARQVGSAVSIADRDTLAALALVAHGAERAVVAGGVVCGDAR